MPQVPASGGDPYARAAVARSGQAPLGSAEGLGFTAALDSAGAKLNANCDYRIARRDAERALLDADRHRQRRAISSRATALPARRLHIQRNRARRARAVSSSGWRARRGPAIGCRSRRRAVSCWRLRLYDLPHSLSAGVLDASEMPEISRERCSS